jgi:hypothetical protein
VRTALLAVPLLALALTGCSDAQDAVQSAAGTAKKLQDCAGLARDVASTGLDRVPTQAEAEAAQKRLEDRVDQIGDETVKEAASALADRVRELTEALRTADRAKIQAKATEARDAARKAASACDVPVGQFLP